MEKEITEKFPTLTVTHTQQINAIYLSMQDMIKGKKITAVTISSLVLNLTLQISMFKFLTYDQKVDLLNIIVEKIVREAIDLEDDQEEKALEDQLIMISKLAISTAVIQLDPQRKSCCVIS
jgi:hypothetical protein